MKTWAVLFSAVTALLLPSYPNPEASTTAILMLSSFIPPTASARISINEDVSSQITNPDQDAFVLARVSLRSNDRETNLRFQVDSKNGFTLKPYSQHNGFVPHYEVKVEDEYPGSIDKVLRMRMKTSLKSQLKNNTHYSDTLIFSISAL